MVVVEVAAQGRVRRILAWRTWCEKLVEVGSLRLPVNISRSATFPNQRKFMANLQDEAFKLQVESRPKISIISAS